MSEPAYAFSARTLQTWRDRRLSIAAHPDGGVSATFRFEGSTCGNIPLTLLYSVRLAPAAEEYRISGMGCAPEAGDSGHTRMCSYFENAGRILAVMAGEQPLLGEPLRAALAWRPATSPAGCVCAAASRAHKWLAVLQTLHFALCGNPPVLAAPLP
jgi:hypothetical protein